MLDVGFMLDVSCMLDKMHVTCMHIRCMHGVRHADVRDRENSG